MAQDPNDILQEVSLSDIELTRAAEGRELASSPTAAASPEAIAGGVAPPAPPAAAGVRVGRYELLLELASGGMATVYIGRQFGAGGFERLVAIKRMHPHVAREPELAASFMDEARIASLIRHPNVVNVHDVHDADGEHLLVMDFVEGASLATVMRFARKRRERISRPAALRILVDALQGLHAAHEQCSLEGRPLGIVHRDATPHNILLGIDGSVRLTDFGIAKAAERSVNTATGLAKGKFRYMAPEQARGGALDRRVDVFAMGVVAWELVTGERLFDADADGQVLLAITSGDYRRPTAVDPRIPAPLEQIVMRALSVAANDRFATAQSFADALASYAHANDEVASATDVARLVHEFCGEAVREKRRALNEVLAGRRQPLRASHGSIPTAGASQTGSSAGTSAPLTLDSVKVIPALSSEELAAYRNRRRLVLVGATSAGVLVAGGLIAGAWWLRSSAPRNESVVVSAAPVSSSVAPALSPLPPALSARVRITIRAEQAVTEVRGAGVSDIQFVDNGVELTLPRSERDTRLTVVFADGSEVKENLVPKENLALWVRSTSGPKPAPAVRPTAAPVTPTQKPTGAKTPGLEVNPYE
ncbi:MAG: serine/threonine-protein kinase [Polyangiaceae bacterium]